MVRLSDSGESSASGSATDAPAACIASAFTAWWSSVTLGEATSTEGVPVCSSSLQVIAPAAARWGRGSALSRSLLPA